MIKPFLILLLGSSLGNKLMLPSSAYSLEAGIQRGAFRLGVDANHIYQETRYLDFRPGSARFMPILASFSIVPQIKSVIRPFIGVGYGKVWLDREIRTTASPRWREWETLEDGQALEIKGGLEVKLSRHTAVVVGVRQIYFDTKLTTHRQQFPLLEQYPNNLDYKETKDVNMDTLIVNMGFKSAF